MRSAPDEQPERVLVLTTLGAPERRRLRGRRGTVVHDAGPEPVPTSRVTVIAPAAFADRAAAAAWLEQIREGHSVEAEISVAVAVVNRALHAHRVARADPVTRDVAADQALVVRVGFGDGDAVARGRYDEAWEVPRASGARVRRSMEAPEERFAALLGGREEVLACEELVLRARSDLEAGRLREAALQARIALEALLSEVGEALGDRRAALEGDRPHVADAANAALHGEPGAELQADVEDAVRRMEGALKARRLAGGG